VKTHRVAWALVLAGLGGCAQIAGLEDRSLEGPDAARTDAAHDAAPDAPDARLQDAPDATPDVSVDAVLVDAADSALPPGDARPTDAPFVDAPTPDAADAMADAVADATADAPTWTQASSTALGALRAISGSGPDDVWAVGDSVVVRWDGTGWSHVAPGLETGTSWHGVWSVGSQDIWIVGGGGGGEYVNASYSPVAGNIVLSSVWATGSMGSAVVYAGSANGVLQVAGGSWQSVLGANGGAVLAMGGTQATNVWAAGAGVYWTDPTGWVSEGIPGPFLGLASPAPGVAFVVGVATSVGNVARIISAGGGSSAEDQFVVGGGVTFNAAWAYDAAEAWVVGVGGAMAHFDGIAWTPYMPLTTGALNGVWGTSPSDVWAVGDNGVILHYH
jgi:hypothetical protein